LQRDQESQPVSQVVPDQFKTDVDRQKGYKELQAVFTKVSQENKTKDAELQRIKEENELLRMSQYSPQPQVQQQNQNEDLNTMVARAVSVQTIAGVLQEEAEKNPSEFQERYNYVQHIGRQYPQLTTTSRGVKKLFELGDKLRTDNLRRNAGKALESIFGGPLNEEQTTKLRTLVMGDKAIMQQNLNTNAYMPDTSSSTKSGSDQNQQPNSDQIIKESVKKGDVEGVIKGIFNKALAE
jgi:hypothetical protein